MQLTFDFTEDDLIDFNLYHMAHSPTERGAILTGRLVAALAVIVVGLGGMLALRWPVDWLGVATVLAGAAFAFAIYPSFLRRWAVRHIRKLLREGDNSAVFGTQRMTLSPDGIFEQDRMGERTYRWSAVQRVAEDGRHIFLYVSSTRALVIPVSALAPGTMKQDLLQLVKQYSGRGRSDRG